MSIKLHVPSGGNADDSIGVSHVLCTYTYTSVFIYPREADFYLTRVLQYREFST